MNKLMARIFAVVMVVVMLGTVSFAAEYTVNSSYASGEITTNKAADAEEAVETVLAFATDTATATAPGELDEIIAIEQAADVPAKINIVAEKIAEYDYIIVVFSGANGNPEYARIDNRDKNVTLTDLVVSASTATIEVEGQKYSNVVKASFTVTPDADRAVKAYGAYFKQTGGSVAANDADGITGTEVLVKKDITAEIKATLNFSVAIVGAPSDAVFSATPYISYE